MLENDTRNTAVVSGNVLEWRLGRSEVIDQDPTSAGSDSDCDSVMVKVSRG